jgi:hypothetical protein
VLTAVILSGMTAQWLLGPYLMLGYPKLEPATFSFMYKMLAIIAVISGATGAIFCKVVLLFDKFRRTLAGWLPASRVRAGLCVPFASRSGSLSGPARHGQRQRVCCEEYLFAARGGSALGRTRGRTASWVRWSPSAPVVRGVSSLLPSSWRRHRRPWIAPALRTPDRGEFNLLVLAGMTAFLTGVTRSPFTSAILVLEMTDRHSVIFQLMYAAMVASSWWRYAIDRKSYYERMKSACSKAMPLAAAARNRSGRVRGVDPVPQAPDPGAGF